MDNSKNVIRYITIRYYYSDNMITNNECNNDMLFSSNVCSIHRAFLTRILVYLEPLLAPSVICALSVFGALVPLIKYMFVSSAGRYPRRMNILPVELRGECGRRIS
jgi:hypothetical protein